MNPNITEEGIRSNFSQLPNIITELGLNPYEMALYVLLKTISGKRGQVIYSNKALAEMSGMSKRKLMQVKKRLSSTFDILGCPLIIITKRTNSKFGDDTDDIRITNIWPQNEDYFKKENKQNLVPKGGVCSTPPPVHHMHPPGAPHAPLLRNIIKKYKNKKESSSISLKPESEKPKTEIKECDSANASPEDDSFLREREKQRIRKACKNLSDLEFEKSWIKYLNQPPGSVRIPSEWIKSVSQNERLNALVSRQREEIINRRKSWAAEEVSKSGAWNRTVTNEAFIIQSGALTKIVKFVDDNEFWRDMNL